MAGLGAGPDEPIVAINITPLVDVVLVLLIVLMVSASAIAAENLPVDLPRASTGAPPTEPTTLTITIDADGGVHLEGARVALDALVAQAQRARALDPETRAIVAADGRALHARVIDVVDALREAGVTKLAFATSPAESSREAIGP